MKEVEDIVIKYRFVFKEKQDPKKIFKVAMGSSAKSELLKDIKKGMKKVEEIVNEINSWPEEKIKEEYEKRGLEEKKQKKKKELVFPKLENVVEGKVITAYPPEPSKYPHIGHAYACYINYLFAKKHNGKFFIRFEDTNPNLAKEQYYKAQLEGYEWLNIKPDGIIYASDHIPLMYEKAEFLIINDKAYVCTCDAETIRENRKLKKECACRNRSEEENLKLWQDMLENKFKKGEASLRLKLDMKSKKAEFRDPIIMRINDAVHPRTGTKYVVWPAYVFQSALLDGYNEITHRFRSKEFEPWKPVQKEIAKMLGLQYPITYEYARVNLKGIKASGRKIRELVESGKIDWDDVALTTLAALKRRGFLPEAMIEFINKMGLSKTESTIDWSVLEAMNRKILANKDIKRIASFRNPLKVKVVDENNLLKDFKENFGFIESSFEENKEARIRHFGNVVRKNNTLFLTSLEPKKGLKILPFAHKIIEVKILLPDLEKREDFLFIDENAFNILKENEIVFFENYGFCKLEDKKNLVFVFTHQ